MRRTSSCIGGLAGKTLLISTVIASTVIASPAAADETDADLERFYGQTVRWGPCKDARGTSQ